MRLAADFNIFLMRAYVVYRNSNTNTDTVTTPPSSTELHHYLKTLPTEKRRALINDFVTSSSIHPDVFNQDTIGGDISKEPAFTRAAMHQIALGDINLCTHAIRFSDEFMYRISQHTTQSITQVLNKTIKNSLDQVWDENGLTDSTPIPDYFHVVDYVDGKPEDRGPGGFHVHGMVVADNDTIPYVLEAFALASHGYKSGHTIFDKINKAVHFGEPKDDYSRRDGINTNCLSDYPDAVRFSSDEYDFAHAGCVSWKEKRVRNAEKALKVNAGKMWGRSDGLNAEAIASLGVFKILLDNLSY